MSNSTNLVVMQETWGELDGLNICHWFLQHTLHAVEKHGAIVCGHHLERAGKESGEYHKSFLVSKLDTRRLVTLLNSDDHLRFWHNVCKKEEKRRIKLHCVRSGPSFK
ncbi:hypothetical protein ACHAW6_000159 [Cyclotella cf. meneghiniana]